MLLGLLLLVLPQMYGVGYPVLAAGIAGRYTILFLLVLLVAKMFATSLTIGIGGSGGVFAPSQFIGAMLGSAFGEIMHILAPAIAGPVGAYGLIGMGAFFAATLPCWSWTMRAARCPCWTPKGDRPSDGSPTRPPWAPYAHRRRIQRPPHVERYAASVWSLWRDQRLIKLSSTKSEPVAVNGF